MQLSSRILTALAVLILAVAVVAVRAGSPGTVEAATGTIDVLNVGTCYATDTEVFAVGDCWDGDQEDIDGDPNTGDGYVVATRDSITEAGTVYATYAHDPKTAPDDPRGVLMNSNLIKISVSDTERDKRTPVLLAVTGVDDAALITGKFADDTVNTADVDESMEDPDEGSALDVIRDDFDGIRLANRSFRWNLRDATNTAALVFTATSLKHVNGITINKGTDPNPGTPGDVPGDDAEKPYNPMFILDGRDNSPISLYGMYDADGAGAGEPEFMKLNKYLTIDEDVGSGRNMDDGLGDEVSPWFSVKVSIPTDATVTLQYVVYQTSERELLIGDHKEGDYSPSQANENTDLRKFTPDYTKSERSSNSSLLVEARSDGDDRIQKLRLLETSRFSGRYEGYLKLTDPNGDDQGWGLETMNASGILSDQDGAAVIGVESGPVVIAYGDTDGGAPRTLTIAIDSAPPVVQIDTPAHKSQGQDTSPEFAGSFSDDASGIRDDSFRLYIDHTNDENEGDATDGTEALPLHVEMVSSSYGYVAGDSDGVVESTSDYTGYATEGAQATYGVIGHAALFNRAIDDPTDVKAISQDPLDDGDTSGTFADSERISFRPEADYNNTIDFQALVADVAGNIGFSDSDADGPRFINNLGAEADKQKPEDYNVLGWYARHVFSLDEVDPIIQRAQTVTGFYGENDDGVPQPNRAGVLVAFDRPVDADSVTVNTFSVTLDASGPGATGASAEVVDVDVDGRAVYLLLSEDLASDATPSLDLARAQWVSDPAGNRLTSLEEAVEAKDGIAPVLSVSLSDGTGTGEGGEGPSSLTKGSITVMIDSDEEINSTPQFVVVCSNIKWGDDLTSKALSDLVDARDGSLEESTAVFGPLNPNRANNEANSYDCGYKDSNGNAELVNLQQIPSYSRPGLVWEQQWVNFDKPKMLRDGNLTVLAYARDRRSFENLDLETRYNWGSATAEFRFDTTLDDPDATPDGSVPVTESRPFVLLTYNDKSTVAVEEFSIDGTVQEISSLGGNRFLYWPDELALGSHDVKVQAIDAAGVDATFEYSFKVAEREAFNLKLIAGWNAVSLPANPVNPMIEDVFTEDVVDMVAGWDATDPEKPWSIATRMEGEWSTDSDFATLSRISAQYGYWVHAQGFVTQRVQLVGQINRTDPSVVPADLVSIPTEPGWNFVGVIDQDGDQTQANDGETLETGDTPVTAGSYLGDNKRAYTWDAVRSEFKVLEDGDEVKIGDGIWVYYGGGIAP